MRPAPQSLKSDLSESKRANRATRIRRIRRRTRLLQLEPLEARHLLAIFTWIGAGDDGNWNTTGNWSGGAAPSGTTHTLVFNTGNVTGAQYSTNNDIPDLTDITIQVLDGSTAAGANFTLAGNEVGLSAAGLSNATGAAADTTLISLNLSGPGGITSSGPGRLTLTGSNSFDGVVTVSGGGFLRVNNTSALGSTAAGVILQNSSTSGGQGTTLELNGTFTVPAGETLEMNSNSSGDRRTAMLRVSGTPEWAGPITVKGSGLTQFYHDLKITGDIMGGSGYTGTVLMRGSGMGTIAGSIHIPTGTLSKTDGSTFVIGAAGKTYNWTNTQVSVGTLRLAVPDLLPATTVVNIGQGDGSSPVLDLNGNSQTIAGLTHTAGTGGTKSVTSTAAATLTVNNATARTYGGVISGAGLSLTKTGAGNLTLSGTNTFGGDTRIGDGAIILGNALALQNSTLNLDAADTGGLSFGMLTAATFGGLKGTRDMALQNTTPAAVALTVGGNNQSTEYSGNLTGLGSLAKAGTGTLTLTGANTYAGVTAINAGVLSVSSDGNLGTPPASNLPGSLTISGATLQATAGFTLDSRRGIALGPGTGSGTGTIEVAAGETLVYDGIMANNGAGTGSLSKMDAGTLALGGASTYGGSTTILAGTVQLTGGDNRLPTGTTVAFSGTSSLDVGSTSQTLSAMTFPNTTSTTTISGAGGSLIVNGVADLQIGPGGALGSNPLITVDMSNLSNFTYQAPANTFRVGLKSGTTNSVALGQVATVTLAQNNTITAAILAIGDTSASNDGGNSTLNLGAANALNVNAINVGASGRSDATLTFAAGLTDPTVTIRGTSGGDSAVPTWNIGTINQFNGAGQTTFTAAVNLSSGSLDARVTALRIANADSGSGTTRTGTGNASLVMGAGDLAVDTLTVGRIAGTGTISGTFRANGAFTLDNPAGTLRATTIRLAENLITATGGTRQVVGTLNLTNGTVLAQDLQLGTQTGNATTTASLNWTAGAIRNYDAATDLTVTDLALTANGAGERSFMVDAGRTVTANAIISQTGGAAAIAKDGDGTLILGDRPSGSNNNAGLGLTVNTGTVHLSKTSSGSAQAIGTGGLTINDGLIVATGSGGDQIANAAEVTINGGRLDLNGTNETIDGLKGSGGSVVNDGGWDVTLTVGAGNDGGATYSGVIADRTTGTGTIALVKNGTGTQTLSGNNTYTGDTLITGGGKLQAGHDNAFGTTGTVTITNTANNQLFLSNGVNVDRPLVIQGGAVVGQGALHVPSGAATYSGQINITGNASAGGHFGGGTLTLAGPITSSVNVVFRAGTMIVANSGNSFDSASVGGTVRLAADNVLPTHATVTVGAGTTGVLDLNGYNQSLNAVTKGANAATINNTAADTTSVLTLGNNDATSEYAGVLANSGTGATLALIKTGSGTLTLSGTNSYTGGTTVNDGTLQFSTNNNLGGTGGITLGAATLESTAATAVSVNRTVTLTDHSSLRAGAGPLSLTGMITDGGASYGLSFLSGVILVENPANDFDGPSFVLSGATLGGSGTVGGPVTVNAGGFVTPGTSPGILTFGNGLALNSNATLTIEINAFAGVPLAGTHYDQADVLGSVNLNADSDTGAILNLVVPLPVLRGSTYTLINNDGSDSVQGTFADLAEGETITIGTNTFVLSYVGGDGNDVVLRENGSPPDLVFVDDSGSNFNLGHPPELDEVIPDADFGAAGYQTAIYGVNAFSTIAEAIAAVSDTGRIVVNAGTYAEDVNLNRTVTLQLTESPGITTTSFASIAGSTVDTFGLTLSTDGGADPIAGVIAGTGGLNKIGTGTLTLSGANTYSGDTTISAGTLKLGAANVIPDGAGRGNVVFDPASGTATLDLGGFSETINGLSSSGAGSSFVDTSVAGGPYTLTLGGGNASGSFGGVIRNTAGTVALIKTGTGTQTLSGANTYSGATIVSQGTLKLGVDNSLPTTTALTVGSGTTVGTLDMAGFNQTIGALTAAANNAAPSSITIGSDTTLTVSGDLTLANNTDGGRTDLTMNGAGSLVVNGANIRVGNNTGGTNVSSKANLDLTALSSFTATLSGSLIVQASGDNSAADTASLRLSNTANSITATNVYVGNSATGGVNTLTLGAGTNLIQADTVHLGRGNRDSGVLSFGANTTGTVTLRNRAGTGRAAVLMGNNSNQTTGYTTNNVFDTTGHSADLLIGTLTTAPATRTGTMTNTFSFDQGTLDIATINLAVAKGSGSSTNTLNIGGGTVSLGNAGAGSVTLATAATGILNITGGVVTSSVTFTKATGAGTATVTLNGGTLDMGGRNLGGATAINTLNFQSGTLQNVAQINNGAIGLTKTTAGTLILAGTNAYSGDTIVVDGTLQLGSDDAIPDGTGKGNVSVVGTLDLNGLSDTINGLSGSGTIDNTAAGAAGLTVGNNDASGTFDGAIQNTAGAVSLTKIGAGVLTLTADHTYAGTTTVSGGTLALVSSTSNNTLSQSPTIDVQTGALLDVTGLDTGSATDTLILTSGQTLKGTGTVTGNVTALAGSHTAPGSSVGIQTYVGDLSYNTGANLDIEIVGGFIGTPVAGTNYDQIDLQGQLNLDADDGGGVTLNLSISGGAIVPGSMFTIINNDGADPVQGTIFDDVPDGGMITAGGNTFYVFYSGGDGNDVVLLESSAIYVEDTAWNSLNVNDTIADADFGRPGNQPAIYGVTAFNNIADALTAAGSAGRVIVNDGDYPEAVSLTGTQMLTVTLGATVTTSSLAAVAGTTVEINGTALVTGDVNSTTVAGSMIGAGGLTKQGSGTLTLTGAATHGGVTTVNGGTLSVDTDGSLNESAELNLGAGTFQVLNGATATVGSVTNAAGAGSLLVDEGTMTVASGLAVDTLRVGNMDPSGGTATLTVNGGAVTIGNGTETLDIGMRQNNMTTNSGTPTLVGTLNLTAASEVTIDVAGIRMGNILGAPTNEGTVRGNLQLSTGGSNTITATTILAGDSSDRGNAVMSTIQLGGASNAIRATSLTLGGRKSQGQITNPGNGSLVLEGKAPGSRVNVDLANSADGTGAIGTGNLNMSSGTITALIDVLRLGRQNTGGGLATGTLTFAAGSVSANSVAMGTGTRAVGVVQQNGGTFTVVGSVTDGTGSGRINVDRGTMTVGTGLTVDNLRVGCSDSFVTTASLTVAGGAVAIGTGAAGNHLEVGRRNSNNNNNATGTLDLTDAVSVNINVDEVRVGTSGNGSSGTAIGNLLLSQIGTNTVTANSILVSDSSANTNTAAPGSKLQLGGNNVLQANNVTVGGRKGNGEVSYASPGGALFLTGEAGGSSTANLSIGSNVVGNTGTHAVGLVDLTGGTVQASLNGLYIGRHSEGGGSGTGTLAFDAGVIAANAIELARTDLSGSGSTNDALTKGFIDQSGGTLQFGTLTQFNGTAAYNWSGGRLQNLPGQDLSNANVPIGLLGAAEHEFEVDQGQSATIQNSASFVGDGGWLKTGEGTLVLIGNNSYEGNTTIHAGTLRLGAGEVIPDGPDKGTVVLASDGTLDLGGFDETINGLSGSGSVDNTLGTDTYTLTVGGAGATSTFSGTIQNSIGAVALTKVGTGTLRLTGTSSYAGLTDVQGGILLIDGENTSAGAVTVNGSAMLGGVGTIAGQVTVNSGGTITGGTLGTIGAPGAADVGTLTVGSLSLDGGTFQADLVGDAADQIRTSGTINLASGTLSLNAGGSTTAGTSFRLIDNTAAGSIAGPFSTIAEGDTATVNGRNAYFSYIGGTGNDFTLNTAGAAMYTETVAGADFELRLIDTSPVATLELLRNGTVVDSRRIDFVNSYTINGIADETDTLTVNYTASGGFFDIPVTFDGGAGGNDSLTITGGAFTEVTLNHTDAHSGSVDVDGTVVTYTGLEPVLVGVGGTHLTVNLTDGDDTTQFSMLDADADTNVDDLEILSLTGTHERTTVLDIGGYSRLSIHGGGGDDRLLLAAFTPGVFTGELAINGGGQTDFVLLGTALNVASLDVTAAATVLNANVTTSGGGEVAIHSAAWIGNSITIDTSAGSGGDVSFAGTVSGLSVSPDLTINAGTGGMVTFADEIGAFSIPIPAPVGYFEVGGRIVAEAEEFTRRTATSYPDNWLIVPDEDSGAGVLAGARGDGRYIQSLPDQAGTGGSPTGAPSIEYDFFVTTAGTYRLYLRWANNQNVGGGGNSDSIFVDIVQKKDGVTPALGTAPNLVADWYQLGNNNGTFAWDGGGQAEANVGSAANNPVVWSLTPGLYTFRISQREDGAAVDAWTLQQNSRPAPSGVGPGTSYTGVELNDLRIVSAKSAAFEDTVSATSFTQESVVDVTVFDGAVTLTDFNVWGGDAQVRGDLTVTDGGVIGLNGATATLTAEGAVSIGTGSGNFVVGQRLVGSSLATVGTVDFSAASSVSLDLDELLLGYLDDGSANVVGSVAGTLSLSAAGANMVNANVAIIAYSEMQPNTTVTSVVTLGGSTNDLNITHLLVGGTKSDGRMDIVAGGTLELTGKAGAGTGTLTIGQRATSTSFRSSGTMDLSGASNVDIQVDQIRIGVVDNQGGTGDSKGTLILGDTNLIDAKTIVVSESEMWLNQPQSVVRLGADNTIKVDSFTIGGSRGDGLVNFRAAGGTLNLTGSTGAAANLFIGNCVLQTTNTTRGEMNLNGGTFNATLDNLQIGFRERRDGQSPSTTGILSFDAGTVTANILTIGKGVDDGAGAGRGLGTLNVGGGSLTVGSIAMAVGTSTGSTGTINQTGGTIAVTGPVVDGVGTSTINVDNGTMTVANGLAVDNLRVGFRNTPGTATATLAVNGGAVSIGNGTESLMIGTHDGPSTATTVTGTLDLENASSVAINVASVGVGIITAGSGALSGNYAIGNLRLSDIGTNTITADSITLSDSANYSGNADTPGSTLTLGTSANIIATDTFYIGRRKGNALVAFSGPGGTLDLGSALQRTDLVIGLNDTGTSSFNRGELNLTGGAGGTLYLNDLTVGSGTTGSTSGGAVGLFTGGAGTIDIGPQGSDTATILVARNDGGSTSSTGGVIGTIDWTAVGELIAEIDQFLIGTALNSSTAKGTVLLAHDNTVYADLIRIGDSTNVSHTTADLTSSLTLGGSNDLFVDTFRLGERRASAAVDVRGPGSSVSLAGRNVAGTDLVVGRNAVATSSFVTGTLDLSNAATFNATLGQFHIGVKGDTAEGRARGLVTLASDNAISVNQIIVGQSGDTGATGANEQSQLRLGGGVNTITTTASALDFLVGDRKTTGLVEFAMPAGVLNLGTAANPVNLVLGRKSVSTAANPAGTMDLRAGTGNISANNLTLGQVTNTSGTGVPSGTLQINGGTVTVTSNLTLGDRGRGTVDFEAGTLQFGTLWTVSGTPDFNWSGGRLQNPPGQDASNTNVTIDLLTSTNHEFEVDAGRTATIQSAASLADVGSLLKSGAGTLTFSGANTFSGETVIESGTLALVRASSNNNVANSSAITVDFGAVLDVTGLNSGRLELAAGQTLRGNGTVTGNVTATATSRIEPGSSAGVLTIHGNVVLQSSSTYRAEIGGLTPGSGSGFHDQLVVNGTLTINTARLDVALLDGFAPNSAVQQSFVIIANDETDDVIGTFAGLPEGSPVQVGGSTLYITYSGGDGNDVVLNSQPVVNGTNGMNDTLVLRRDTGGTNLVFSLNGAAFVALGPIAALPNFTFNGLNGHDLMIVDATYGLPMPIGGAFFHGGANTLGTNPDPTPGTNVGDSLQVIGAGDANHAYAYLPDGTTTGHGAMVVVQVADLTPLGLISFTGLDSFNNQAAAVEIGNVAVAATVFPGNDDVLTLADGRRVTSADASLLDALVISGSSGGRTFTPLAVQHAGLLLLDTGLTATGLPPDGVADSVTIAGGSGHGIVDVVIDTRDGTLGVESVRVTGTLSVLGSIEVSSLGIDFDGGTLVAGPGGAVTLDAGGGAIGRTGTNVDVIATDLTANATAGIVLHTNVTDAALANTGTGDVRIDDDGELNLLGLTVVDGDAQARANGALTDGATAVVSVSGNATFSGTSITLGDSANDSFHAGSLTFSSGGAVQIIEDG
ncbi:MAG: autotransporter-associated beta strand repeat-containing protein, partial [Pirellulaceae bacterium]|nr:autotransporter-associated beta strand repeat-containing protein [Pirellulaceae bacterium]